MSDIEWPDHFNLLAAGAFEKFTIFPKGREKGRFVSSYQFMQSWEIEHCSLEGMNLHQQNMRNGTFEANGFLSMN